jgi:hypothetical protein
LNPIVESDGQFDVTDDYPRSDVENYQQDVESGRRESAVVIKATFDLEPIEIDAVSKEYGDGVLANHAVEVSNGYAKDNTGKCKQFVNVPVVESALVKNLIGSFGIPDTLKDKATQANTLAQLSEYLEEVGQKQVHPAEARATVALT